MPTRTSPSRPLNRSRIRLVVALAGLSGQWSAAAAPGTSVTQVWQRVRFGSRRAIEWSTLSSDLSSVHIQISLAWPVTQSALCSTRRSWDRLSTTRRVSVSLISSAPWSNHAPSDAASVLEPAASPRGSRVRHASQSDRSCIRPIKPPTPPAVAMARHAEGSWCETLWRNPVLRIRAGCWVLLRSGHGRASRIRAGLDGRPGRRPAGRRTARSWLHKGTSRSGPWRSLSVLSSPSCSGTPGPVTRSWRGGWTGWDGPCVISWSSCTTLRAWDRVPFPHGADRHVHARGRLIFHVFASLAEFERDLIRERTNAGLEAARARGRTGGRPRNLSPVQVAAAQHMLQTSGLPADSVAINRSTLYRAIRRDLPDPRTSRV